MTLVKHTNVRGWLLAASSLGMALSVAVACGDPGNEPDSFPDSWGGGPSDEDKKPGKEPGSGGSGNPEPTEPEPIYPQYTCADVFTGVAENLTWNEEEIRIQLASTEAEVESARLIISGAECSGGGNYQARYNFIDLEVQEDNVLQLSTPRLLTALPLHRFDEVQLELRFKGESELQARWINAKSWSRPSVSRECGEPEVPEWLPVNWCTDDHSWQEPSGQPEVLTPQQCDSDSTYSCEGWRGMTQVVRYPEAGRSQLMVYYWSASEDSDEFYRILDARFELALCDCSEDRTCVPGTESHMVIPAVSESTGFEGERVLAFPVPEGFDWWTVVAAEAHLATECEQFSMRMNPPGLRCGQVEFVDADNAYLFPACLAGVEMTNEGI